MNLDELKAKALTGEHLLFTAVRIGDVAAIHELGASVAPIEWQTGWQRLAIHEARTAAAAKSILACGAPVDVTDEWGGDALERVLSYFDLENEEAKSELCDVLHGNGLPIDIQNGHRMREVCVRQMAGGLRWLLSRGHPTSPALVNECLFLAVQTPWYPCSDWEPEIRETLRLLAGVGADLNALDESKHTTLYQAGWECAWSQEQSVVVMDELIRLGADPLVLGHSGLTALDMLLQDADDDAWEALMDEPPLAHRVRMAERFVDLHPESDYIIALRFLIGVTSSRLGI